jgi:hypothetical protein
MGNRATYRDPPPLLPMHSWEYLRQIPECSLVCPLMSR